MRGRLNDVCRSARRKGGYVRLILVRHFFPLFAPETTHGLFRHNAPFVRKSFRSGIHMQMAEEHQNTFGCIESRSGEMAIGVRVSGAENVARRKRGPWQRTSP
jgi:hypothetical protein